MQITVRGLKDKEKVAELENAANFFINKLLPNEHDNLNVVIGFRNRLADRCAADVNKDDDSCKNFTLRISRIYRSRNGKIVRNRLFSSFIKDVAHEFVHIKQFVRKELNNRAGHKLKWFGDDHGYEKLGDTKAQYELYKKLPWEAEAFRVSERLYRQYRGKQRN
jgi:hypothetical protein